MNSANPFLDAGMAWWRAGWHGVLRLPWMQKDPPPRGETGVGAPYLSRADLGGLLAEHAAGRAADCLPLRGGGRRACHDVNGRHNIGIRLPDDVIALDVDGYKGAGNVLAALESQHGVLPPTWWNTPRWTVGDRVSGHRFYRVPGGRSWLESAGRGIEVLQSGHRYAVVWPSIHPELETQYQLIDPRGEVTTRIPDVGELPPLPERWVAALVTRDRVKSAELTEREVTSWEASLRSASTPAEACRPIRGTLGKYRRLIKDDGQSRHDTAMKAVFALTAFGAEGHAGAYEALDAFQRDFVAVVTRGRSARTPDRAEDEFERMREGAVRRVAGTHPKPLGSCGCEGSAGLEPGFGAPSSAIGDAFEAGAKGEANTGRMAEAGPGDGGAGEVASEQSGNGEPGPASDADASTSAPAALVAAPTIPAVGAFTDAFLAERVAAEVLAGHFVYTGGAGWLKWNGRVWEIVTDEAPVEAVRQWAGGELLGALDRNADSEVLKAHLKLCASNRIAALTKLARGISGVLADFALFDSDPDILVCRNGVVDLQTGNLLPHSPERLVTKSSPITYVPGAIHADWSAVLEALPAEVLDWYRVRLGQAVTGHPAPDDVMIVAQGGGKNGKSSVHGLVARVLGGYYTLVADEVLMPNMGAHPTERMDLKGARFALVEETPEARRLAVAQLKKIVGTETIKARRIRQDPVEWKPTHSLFVSTNYQPIVEETDHGTWRRLLLVRFPYTFTDDPAKLDLPNHKPADPTLRDRVFRSADRDGPAARACLAWLVEGAKAFYAAGRIMPPAPAFVLAATRSWRAESDSILAYVEERLEFDVDRHVMSTDLLTDFNAWLRQHGARAWGEKMLASRFADHEEVASHRVSKSQTYATVAGISRIDLGENAWLGEAAENGYRRDVPTRYMAWHGIRFKGAPQSMTETDVQARLGE